jgi:O-antigen ligase
MLLERVPMRWWQRALLLAVVTYSLYDVFSGVGKGVLIVYPGVLVYFAWYFRFFRRRWFVAGVAGLLALVTGLGAYVAVNAGRFDPGSPFYVYTTFTSRDLSVSTRTLELLNLGSNLYERKALLLGIGLGNKWFSYWPQPAEDLGAFPREEWGSDWHLGMHVPLLRLVLDFGVLGTGVLLALFGACFLSTMRALRSGRLDGVTRAFVLSSWAVIGYQVTVNNLSGPKTNLLAGVLLGVVAGLLSEPPAAEEG